MPKLVLFDIDGTLILSGGAGVRAMSRTFAEQFEVGDVLKGLAVAGRTDRAILADAFVRLAVDLPQERFERFRRRYCELLREEIRRPGSRKGVMPGVVELLGRLERQADAFVGLLSGNFEEAARIKLEYFDLWRYFGWGAYGDEALDRNELPAVALRSARARGVPDVHPGDVVIVGDTPLDVGCARSAGFRSIAVATGDFDYEALRETGANAVLADLGDTDAVLQLI